MTSAEFAENLTADKKAFDAYVYTPLREAMEELERRQADPALTAYVEQALPHGLPEAVRNKKSFVLFRHIATPNYEISRYMTLADVFPDFNTVILEYHDDAFLDRNENKYFLGKLRFQKGLNKDGNPIFENSMLINFNESNNKPISSIFTKWGQKLVDFHHELFAHRFPMFAGSHHDISGWLHLHGTTAKEYYKPFLTFFLRNGILFENLLVDEKEKNFVQNVILPAFYEIEQESGHKPLIVPLAPTKIEASHFWHSHPYASKAFVDGKLTRL